MISKRQESRLRDAGGLDLAPDKESRWSYQAEHTSRLPLSVAFVQ